MKNSPRQQAFTVWFTGLSSAGKTTLSALVYRELTESGLPVELLDGDEIRRNLCSDLGFSKADRDENVRRISYVAKLLNRQGVIVLVSAISPYRAAREKARQEVVNFVEVYVNAPVAVCELRDAKGLYKKARAGEIPRFTGVDDPYEPPQNAEIECHTDLETAAQSASKVLAGLKPWLTGL